MAAGLLAACGASESSSDAGVDAGSTSNLDFFIARQIDFKNFRQWPKYKVYEYRDGGFESEDGGETADGGFDPDAGPSDPNAAGPHAPGDRYAYINKLPPAGSTTFPTGTMIVKIVINPDGTENEHIHVMVKRNGGFNLSGAVGWEWMELIPAVDGSPVILWRDSKPPDGTGYFDPGTIGPQGDCNTCHAMSRDNDFVQSAPLRLKSF